MIIDLILKKFEDYKTKKAITWNDKSYSYSWLIENIDRCLNQLHAEDIKAGTVVEIHGDFSPKSVSMLFALIKNQCIVVPTTKSIGDRRVDFKKISNVQYSIIFDDKDNIVIEESAQHIDDQHPLYVELNNRNSPGLILFSSGSTGIPKAAVHDFSLILNKFKVPRNAKRILNFLLFDHIGGINTMLHTLSNGGCIITISDRNPDVVCNVIQKHKVNVLPTSPTFLNLMLLSGSHKQYDISSLELITYGTEVMPHSTLMRLNHDLPNVKISQTYGLSELGILRAKSKSSNSLFMKIGGEGYQTRILNGMLEIKAESAMLGYLNAASSMTSDGWFRTGDAVELEGEYVRILGRKSEMINVGGEKVYPAEVESVIQQMDDVQDVAVMGESHPLMGQIVKAKITLSTKENVNVFRQRLRKFCQNKLSQYKIPQKIILSESTFHNMRFKKIRQSNNLEEIK